MAIVKMKRLRMVAMSEDREDLLAHSKRFLTRFQGGGKQGS